MPYCKMSDKSALKSWIGALSAVKILQDKPETNLPAQIAIYAALHPEQVALQGERDTLTYGALSKRIDAYASWAMRLGLKRGEAVCLIMSNCTEYPAIWLGLMQVGCVTALINTSLKSKGLLFRKTSVVGLNRAVLSPKNLTTHVLIKK